MAYDESLAKRIEASIALFPEAVKKVMSAKKMFGGLAFLYKGKMTVGVVKDDLMVRVIAGKMEKVLEQDHVRPMDFTNRPMKEFIFVAAEGIPSEEALQQWIELGIEHAQKALSK